MQKFLIAGTIVPILCGADDVLAADPAAVPALDWTGFYVGGGIGYIWSSADFDADLGSKFIVSGSMDPDSVLGTIEAGADYQIADNVVVGIGANFDFMSANSEAGDCTTTGCVSVDINESFDVTARAGFLPIENVLLYGLAGFSMARISLDYELELFGSPESSKSWESGLVLGAGIEALVTKNISAKLEYRYTNYGEAENDAAGILTSSVDVATQEVRTTVVYRFDGP